VENRGWARAYWRFDLSLRLKGDNGTFVIPLDCDNRDWLPDEPQVLDLMLDASAVPAGEYEVAIGLFDGERAIKLALSESLFDEGFYTVGRTEVRNV
jgi:hypothetical protein